MAKAESLWVLDTSVAAAWLFRDDPVREDALAVRADLEDRPGAYVVPPLFFAELVHVLARKSGRKVAFVRGVIETMLRLGLRIVPLRGTALLRTADWACKGLSGYDATFVALSEDVNARWLTADKRAARTAGASRATALSDWPTRDR